MDILEALRVVERLKAGEHLPAATLELALLAVARAYAKSRELASPVSRGNEG